MNCKPGDLAIIVRDYLPCMANVGAIVRVVGDGYFDADGIFCWEIEAVGDPLWVVAIGSGETYIDTKDIDHPDAWLRPLRDTEGVDEMVRIAGALRIDGGRA